MALDISAERAVAAWYGRERGSGRGRKEGRKAGEKDAVRMGFRNL